MAICMDMRMKKVFLQQNGNMTWLHRFIKAV